MTWLNDLKPYTKRIIINKQDRKILLVHPHFKQGTLTFRQLLKKLRSNPYNGYTIEACGFASIKGILILKMIERYLNKLDNVSSVKLNVSISTAVYNLQVNFK